MSLHVSKRGRVSALLAAAVAAATGAVTVGGTAQASSLPPPPVVYVVAGNYSVQTPTSLAAGRTTFRVSTNVTDGSGFNLVKLNRGTTLSKFAADFQKELGDDPSAAAAATRALTSEATWYGGGQTVPGRGVRFTETLYPGTYYAFSDASAATHDFVKRIKAIHVSGSIPDRAFPAYSGTVAIADEDRFLASPRQLPHNGTILLQNRSSDLHFMFLQPVPSDMTDTRLQKDFDAFMTGGQPPEDPFVPGPTAGTGALSPGLQQVFTYNLPSGRYALLCFVADTENGVPHAFMGMHLIVDLK